MSFQDIKGHDNIKSFFKRALGSNKIASSYLFFGPEGTGKTLMAKTVAKAMNCQRQNADSCGECASCAKIENGNHPDVMVVEADEKKEVIKIEQIRELERRISLMPYEARAKVFIIQDSHLMSEPAANCLLKTLEEPPGNSAIMLITARVEDLLLTVRSRCKQIRFEPLELNARLEVAQNMGFSKEEALFLSRLENIDISALPAGEGENLFSYKNRALAEFGPEKELLAENSFVFSESREGMKFIILLIESWFRDISILKTGGANSLLVNSDRAKELETVTDRFSFEELDCILKEIEAAYFCIDRNVGPKLALNDLKIKLTALKKSLFQ